MKAAGAAAVAVTNDGGSPLAEIADEAIDLDVGPEQAVPATKTVTAQLAAFAILAHALGEPLWPEDAWAAVPRAQAEVLADDDAAAAAGAAIARSASHVQLGRGFLFAVALEGALKVAETTGLASPGLLGRRLPPRPDRDRARGHDRGRLRRARAGREGRPRGRGARPRGRRTADRGRRRGGRRRPPRPDAGRRAGGAGAARPRRPRAAARAPRDARARPRPRPPARPARRSRPPPRSFGSLPGGLSATLDSRPSRTLLSRLGKVPYQVRRRG